MWKFPSAALAMTVSLMAASPAISDDIVIPQVVTDLPRTSHLPPSTGDAGAAERIERLRIDAAIAMTVQQDRADQRATSVQRAKNVSESTRANHRDHTDLQRSLAENGATIHAGHVQAAATHAAAASQSFGAVSVADAKVAEVAAEKRGEALVATVNAVKEVKLEAMRQAGAFVSTMMGNPAGAMNLAGGAGGAGGGNASKPAGKSAGKPAAALPSVGQLAAPAIAAKEPSLAACLADAGGGAAAGKLVGPKGWIFGGLGGALMSKDCREWAAQGVDKVERRLDEKFGPLAKPTADAWRTYGLPIVPPAISPGT